MLVSITFVRNDDVSAGLALDVTTAEVLALASLEDLLGPRHVAPSATEILATVVARATSVTLPVNIRFN